MPTQRTRANGRSASKSRSLTFKQTVAGSPAEVSRMFTHPTALRDWACDWAELDGRTGGVLHMRWNTGDYMSGLYTTYNPGRKLTFSWDAKDDPASTRVSISFKASGPGTVVTVAHSGLGKGSAWAGAAQRLEARWRDGLENLKSVIETGIDLRLARRPRLGIFIDDFNAEIAQKLGVPVTAGIRISGTAEGSGARASGLEKDDVIVKFNGRVVTVATLGNALRGRQAGDTVPLDWHRGPQKMKGQLQLSSFPIPEVPATAAELAEAVRAQYVEMDAEWQQAVAGVTEAEADHKEGGEWSVKELIAHFIACARDYQSWVADMLRDNEILDDLEFRPNMDERLRAIVARFKTVPALLAELSAAEAETVALLANLPPAFVARKHLYRRVAAWETQVTQAHFREEHGEPLKVAIAAARRAVPGA